MDFSEGITIVEGENEVGKSSIVEALRLIRTAKASSRTSAIRALQPAGRDVGPEVTLTIEAGGRELTYRKRWLKSPETSLTVEGERHEQFTSDTAHERFLAILRDTVDLDLLAELDTQQGASLEQPQLAQIAALHQALDETGEAAGEHDDLLARVEDEYGRYYTGTGKPNKDFANARSAVTEAQGRVTEARERIVDVDRLTSSHRQHAEKAAELEQELARSKKNLASLDARDSELTALRTALTNAEEALKSAERQLDSMADARRTRQQSIAEVAERKERVAELSHAEQTTRERLKDLQDRTEAAADAERAQATAARQAHRVAATAAVRLDRHRTAVLLSDLEAKFARATAADEELRRAEQTAAASTIDDKVIATLIERETQVRVARAARDSAAPTVRVTRLGETPVRIGDEQLAAAGAREMPVLDTVEIEAPGVVRIEMAPGLAPEELDAELLAAEQSLMQTLMNAGVESVSQARTLAEQHRLATAERDAARAGLAGLLDGTTLPALGNEVAALRAKLIAREDDGRGGDGGDGSSDDGDGGDDGDGSRGDGGDGSRDDGSRGDGSSRGDGGDGSRNQDAGDPHAGDHVIDTEALATTAREAAEADEAARNAAEEARIATTSLRTALDTTRTEHVRAEAGLETARAELSIAKERLATARATRPDDDLDSAVATAVLEVARTREALAGAKEELASQDADLLALELDNARRLVDRHAKHLEQQSKEVTRLQAVLDDRAEQGLFDALSEAEADLEHATARHARMARAATAVQTLRDALLRHRAAAQRRYVAPFKERIEALGRPIFGRDFRVDVTTDLRIASRTLGGVTVPFESLSAGAREQVALLGRLACAELVDPGRGGPLLLDDTFGFADPKRLQAINVVLNATGRNAQIVLLTCQPDRFKDLGGVDIVTLFAD
ncbi:hypothetical protein GCM10010401_09910 [Rarobacter faecitabidus]|uniref:AAA domain-containing protein n=1 Tax=Rarobacter faecitabidus TaxID=13243 RepID=A0A542ZA41_RARFA|nr:AAA domain-containing protein [Rarobacter faecitabidus]